MWMWEGLTLVLAAGMVVLHLAWRRRCRGIQKTLEQFQGAMEARQREFELLALERQAQQEALFNSMAEGVIVLDQDSRIQLVNRSVIRLLGVSSDVRGRTVLEAFRLSELDGIVKRLPEEKTVHGGKIELRGMEDRWLEVNAAAIFGPQNRSRGAILVFHDLTRMKELENTRQEFVANVSHELRTPLSLIKGFVETLLEGAKEDPALVTRFLQTIKKHTDRLTYLIEDLLTISRLESGQVVMNIQPINLHEQVARVVEELAMPAGEKKVTMVNRIPEKLHAGADAERIHQVFFNLLENAIKYGRKEGRVEIGGETLPDNRVRVWVSDDGPGIPEESRERIFERFYRVDRARSRETGGTGLGLAIVKHIIQAHTGEVWVKSQLGGGSTFYFTLPSAAM